MPRESRRLTLPAFVMLQVLNGAVSAESVQLNSQLQRFSYLAGLQVGQSFLRDGLEIDPDAFALAVRDALTGQPSRLSREELIATAEERRSAVSKTRAELLARKSAAEERFLEERRAREGVTELPSGVQYRVLTSGDGEQPAAGGEVTVHYRGTLSDGKEFDSSYRRGEPAQLNLTGVIEGWQEAIPLMRVGDKWELVIPSSLAYGDEGVGGVIGPGEPLVFEVELIAVD